MYHISFIRKKELDRNFIYLDREKKLFFFLTTEDGHKLFSRPIIFIYINNFMIG